MSDVVMNLGILYDELAKLQADAKTADFSDSQLCKQILCKYFALDQQASSVSISLSL